MSKFLQFFINSYNSTKWFILCFITTDCKYSLKKLLAILSFFVIVYLAVFTQKLDVLIAMISFASVLLGLQSIDKNSQNKLEIQRMNFGLKNKEN